MNDVTKLPKWAQDKIRNLERTVERMREEKIAKHPDSPVWIQNYIDGSEHIQENSIAVFQLEGGEVHVCRDRLHEMVVVRTVEKKHGIGSTYIQCAAENTFYVTFHDPIPMHPEVK